MTGGRSEWAMRLPSVIGTLVLALGIVIWGAGWIGRVGGLIASICFLTNLAVLESGRLAELEAFYICFTGLPLVLWLARWHPGTTWVRRWIWPATLLPV